MAKTQQEIEDLLQLTGTETFEQLMTKLASYVTVTDSEIQNMKNISVQTLPTVVRNQEQLVKSRMHNPATNDNQGLPAVINKRVVLLKLILNKLVEKISDELEGYVSYADQSLLEKTDAQKLQAKTNIGLGNVENKTMDATPTTDSDNYVKSGGVKAYVDASINDLDVSEAGGNSKYIKAISEANGKISATVGDIDSEVKTSDNLVTNTAVKAYVDGAKDNLQGQINKIKSVQNVVDTVASKRALNSFSTTDLDDGDCVQVIADESIENGDSPTTIYKWTVTNNVGAWVYVGAYGGNSYTKTYIDSHFEPQESGKHLSTNDYDDTEKGKVADNTTARHTHSNKALLDTYTQSETNLADAVTKKHSHSNKTVLDNTTASYTTSEQEKLSNIESGAQVNVLEGVQINGVDLSVGQNKKVDITVPTKVSDLDNDSGFLTQHQNISGKQNSTLSTALSINGASKTTVEDALSALNTFLNSIDGELATLEGGTGESTLASTVATLREELTTLQTAWDTFMAGTDADEITDTLISIQTNIATLQAKTKLSDFTNDLTKSDVGLGNVDNTSDANKPVSTAQQTALNAKVNNSDYQTNAEVDAIFDGGTGTHDNKYLDKVGLQELVAKIKANSLDQNGSQWLREEWEKGLNLFNNLQLEIGAISGYGYDVVLNTRIRVSQNSKIYLKRGTYTIDFDVLDQFVWYGYTSSNAEYATYNTNANWQQKGTLFTLTNDCWVRFAFRYTDSRVISSVNEISNIMLNEGDHAYPYQEYNGAIVHQKQLDEELAGKVDKVAGKQLSTNDFTNQDKTNLDNVVDTVSNASVDITSTTALKYSGVSDNLALPSKSQVEVKKVVANSYQYNQVVNPSFYMNRSIAGLTITNNNNGTTSISGTATSTDNYTFLTITNSYLIVNHKYLISTTKNLNLNLNVNNASTNFNNSSLFTFVSSAFNLFVGLNIVENQQYNETFSINLFDLTAMGIDTSDVDVAKAELLKRGIDVNAYNEYSAGKLINTTLTKIATTGVNLWDEQWELGQWNSITGEAQTNNGKIRSQNFISIQPNETYCQVNGSGGLNINFYDIDKQYLGNAFLELAGTNKTFKAPQNAYFMKFSTFGSTTTTYNHDICINVSNSAVNGNYYPYSKTEYAVGFSGKSAGTAHDEQVGKIKTTRVTNYTFTGSENWQYSSTYQFFYVENLISSNAVSVNNGNNITSNGIKLAIIGDGRTVRAYLSENSQLSASSNMNTIFASGTIMNYELATPTTSEADDLPIMAVDYCGSEEQIYTGCPATITENYDISVKDQVITNVQVDAKQEEEINKLKDTSVVKEENKGLYPNTHKQWVEKNINRPVLCLVDSSTSKYVFCVYIANKEYSEQTIDDLKNNPLEPLFVIDTILKDEYNYNIYNNTQDDIYAIMNNKIISQIVSLANNYEIVEDYTGLLGIIVNETDDNIELYYSNNNMNTIAFGDIASDISASYYFEIKYEEEL